ncbi:hypothetical protein [Chitinophaga vietnamensis]|uniref:hypothetical protein n=2 Tax=Chitinophaga vietnamensis TaxID=2593957 RepID=UPI001178C7A4|nr:hypothetical protein [Chitinophaga vietnamensis]
MQETIIQMINNLICCFFAGFFFANGIPHFVKGITKENYPCLFGNRPIPNLLAGWTMLLVSLIVFHFTVITKDDFAAQAAVAVGALSIGLFHAGPGAFGAKS